jgi:uncharacterized protein YehS (DUF1456 family)
MRKIEILREVEKEKNRIFGIQNVDLNLPTPRKDHSTLDSIVSESRNVMKQRTRTQFATKTKSILKIYSWTLMDVQKVLGNLKWWSALCRKQDHDMLQSCCS